MNSKQAGFTLVELVVGMLVMLLIMGGLANLVMTLMKQGVRGSDQIDRQQEARWVVDMIAQDIRYANTFVTKVGTSNTLEVIKTDSKNQQVDVKYYMIAAGAASNYILTRDIKIPSTASAVTATNPLGNADRGYAKQDDFTIKVTAAGTKVSQVDITYKIRHDLTDLNPAIAQTTVYPFNGVTATN